MKQVTPVIKRTRVRTEKYEVCPHCRKEIGEKESYVDPENYVYHRACQDKGPIDHFDPMSAEEFRKTFFRLNNKDSHQASVSVPMQKTAGGYPVKDVSGFVNRNIAGKDYKFNWVGSIGLVKGDRSQDSVRVDKPEGMPDYMWFQTKDTIEGEAMKAAVKQVVDYLRQQKPAVKASWLDRSGLEKKAQFADVDGPEEDFEGGDDDGHHVTAAKGGKKPSRPEGQPIDEALLADGLGAFLDVFVNYHSGREGDKLAKWVIAICADPKYAEVARKLEQFHGLMGEIYRDVVEISNQDESARGKVAAVLKKVKTAAIKSLITDHPSASKFMDEYLDSDWSTRKAVAGFIMYSNNMSSYVPDGTSQEAEMLIQRFRKLTENDQKIVRRIVQNEDKYKDISSLDLKGGHEILPLYPENDPLFENAVRSMEEVAAVKAIKKSAQWVPQYDAGSPEDYKHRLDYFRNAARAAMIPVSSWNRMRSLIPEESSYLNSLQNIIQRVSDSIQECRQSKSRKG